MSGKPKAEKSDCAAKATTATEPDASDASFISLDAFVDEQKTSDIATEPFKIDPMSPSSKAAIGDIHSRLYPLGASTKPLFERVDTTNHLSKLYSEASSPDYGASLFKVGNHSLFDRATSGGDLPKSLYSSETIGSFLWGDLDKSSGTSKLAAAVGFPDRTNNPFLTSTGAGFENSDTIGNLFKSSDTLGKAIKPLFEDFAKPSDLSKLYTSVGLPSDDTPVLKFSENSLLYDPKSRYSFPNISGQLEEQEHRIRGFLSGDKVTLKTEKREDNELARQTNSSLTRIEEHFQKMMEIMGSSALIANNIQGHATTFLASFEKTTKDTDKSARTGLRIALVALGISIFSTLIPVGVEIKKWFLDDPGNAAQVERLMREIESLKAHQDSTSERSIDEQRRVTDEHRLTRQAITDALKQKPPIERDIFERK